MKGGVILQRWECEYLRRYRGGWLLVYGRRKTGKTSLLRNCLDWDVYATVAHSGKFILSGREGPPDIAGLDECMSAVTRGLRSGATVVIDEFQRLPLAYWDLLSASHWEAEGLLVLCGSSMGIVRKVFSPRSPLLGLLQAFHVDIASVEDTIFSLASQGLSPERGSTVGPPC